MKKLLVVLLVSLGLQTQAQINLCDSITYWINQVTNGPITLSLDTTSISFNPDSIQVYWGLCSQQTGICYGGQGITTYFSQITTTDTIKVSYDVYFYENGVAVGCSREDWLVFNYADSTWMYLNMLPTSINELTSNKVNDGRMYDMLGRELSEIPTGTMYIKNGKKYIRTR